MNAPSNLYQSLPKKIVAGMFDAGLSSVATFLIGVIAIRNLSPAGLGVYSVLFSAFLFGSLVATEGYFVPRSLSSMKLPPGDRLDGIANAMKGSVRYGLIGALVVAVAVAVVGGQESVGILIPESLATIGIIVVSPMQVYLRISFHLAEKSGRASVVAAIQLVSVVALERIASLAGLPAAGLPLVLLFGANCISLAVGLALAGSAAGRGHPAVDPDIDGRATLRSALYMSGAALLGSMIMARLVGPAVVGYAEAARTLGQPVVVVGIGLLAAVSSRSLSMTQARNRAAVRRVNSRYLLLLMGSAIVCVLPFLVPPISDRLADFLPAAFVVDGLIIATVAANVAMCATFLLRDQLIKGGVAPAMARVDLYSSATPLLASLASPFLGAFARPVGMAAQHVVRALGFRKLWVSIFEGEALRGDGVSQESGLLDQ